MNNQVLTGEEARKTLRSHKTEDRCGYFKHQHIGGCWFVWDNRSPILEGVRQDSEEACKQYLL